MQIVAGASPLSVSLILCTRDRGLALVGALDSILSGELLPDEILVVDQSDDTTTQVGVRRIQRSHPFVRYLRSDTRGLSAARNVGITASSGDILVFLDDDCLVAPDWLARVREIFRSNPRINLVAGSVAPPEGFDWSNGYVPNVKVAEGNGRRHPYVMGANMAIRRSAVELTGPFDEDLGAGTPGRAGEDMDYLLRMYDLFGPASVYGIADALVVHEGGGRLGDEGRRLIDSYGFGEGATLGRQLRRRSKQVFPFSLLLARNYFHSVWSYVSGRSRSVGWRRLKQLLRGVAYGYRAGELPTTWLKHTNGALQPRTMARFEAGPGES
jgi:glycosyltransferase involved in cell wall biosynthesis